MKKERSIKRKTNRKTKQKVETFTASLIAEIFPPKITIDKLGVTLNDPGLFGGKEKTIPFSRISSVDIRCPVIGYSTIIIETTGDGKIKAYGFEKSKVEKMKKIIINKI